MPENPGHKGEKLARFDLVPPDFLWGLAELFGWGAAAKYAERNWERGYEWRKAISALHRHLAQWQAGEDVDDESGQSHLLHAAFHLAVLFSFQERGLGVDDRTRNCGPLRSELLNPEDIQAARAEVSR